MKISEYYKNNFPLEPLLKMDFNNDFNNIEKIVKSCDYTIEADGTAKNCEMPMVNIYDAAIFYIMGFEAAMKRIEQCLIPIETPKLF